MTLRINALPMVMIGCIVLAACNGSNGTFVGSSPTPAPSPANISGDYLGNIQDGQGNSGLATATLAQHGSSAGGAMVINAPSGSLTAQLSLVIDSSNALTGAMVINFPSGATCTYSATGTYSNNGATSAVIAGSYTAVTNCSGDSGTFTLNQQCTDTITSVQRQPERFPTPC